MKKSRKKFYSRIKVLALVGFFLSTQIIGTFASRPLIAKAFENVYTRDFNNGEVGEWTNLVGSGTLTVENGQLKIIRNNTDNKLSMVDSKSPELLDAEAQCDFTLVGGTSRFGIVLRGASATSQLFIGNNVNGSWLVETNSAWKDDIAGPTLVANQKYTLKVRVVGKKITIWLDGEQFFDSDVTLADWPTTAGKAGFRTWYDDKSVFVDNFKYGTPGSIVDIPVVKTIKSLTPVNVTTFKGVQPSIPSEVTAVYDNGTSGQEKVTWDAIDASKYNTIGSFVVQGIVEGTSLKAIANVTVNELASIESDKLKVTIDNTFPRISKYEYKSSGALMYGQDDVIKSVKINGTSYEPTVVFSKPTTNKALYSMNFSDIKVTMDTEFVVNDNVISVNIKNIKENGTAKVNSIEIPNQNLISVRSNQPGAAFAGAHMYTAVSGTGDVFLDLNKNTSVDATPAGYMYAFLNTSELSAGIWTNSVYDKPAGITKNDNGRIMKSTVSKDGYFRTGLWSGQWTYRAEGMTTTEPLPSAKIIITEDENGDKIVDWQDGAIAFRSIMNNPVGAENVKNLVVQRIPMNFASQATNPFLKVLDETKRVYLATDGLGQNVLLKGYGSEGHDSAHPDYGIIGQRQGGAVDMKTLVDEGAKYNASFGVHINATESYPEAKAFNEQLVDKTAKGWDWLDPSYYIDTRKDATSGNRLSRLKELKDQVPNLEFIYLDVWYGDGWLGRQVARDINSMDWRLETEFPNVLENDATWNHWAVDYSYGGQDTKGFNSNIVQFIRNHQKDTWIAKDPLLGGAEMSDYEGWQGRTNFDDMINMTFNIDLPTKYLQHFPITKWTKDTINLEDNVSVSNATGTRIITKDNIEVLKGSSYLLPWNTEEGAKDETKLYHWNPEGGSTTWTLPVSWSGLKNVKLYKLSDQGKSLVETLKVSDNKVTINAEANVAYVVYKGKAAPQNNMKWGEGTAVKDPGFNNNSLSNWKVKGEAATVVRNDRGQYELKVGKGNGATLTQELTGLSEGTYSASTYVEVDGKRRASISVKNSGGIESTNYTDSSIAKNYISADSKHSTNMQRMRVLFDVPAGKTKATLTLKVEGGLNTVTFDDLRIVKTERSPKPEGAYFYEDFENIDQGVYPFVKGIAGGVNDPRTHLSELHAPYTQKGWNGKVIDDVIEGNWSLKLHEESTGLLVQTIPQNLRFKAGKSYKVSFKYEAEMDGDYSFLIGNGLEISSTQPFAAATEPKIYTKEFKAGINGESWIGVKCVGGRGDMVIDDFLVEEIPFATSDTTEIVPVDMGIIPNSLISTTATSEELGADDAVNAIDGDPKTLWHTKWDLSDVLPQSITLNFGAEFDINRLTILPRQEGGNGLIKRYSLSVSTNGTDFTELKNGTWDTTNADTKYLIKEIAFDKVKAKYVKLTVLEGVGGWASAAEIVVYRNPVSIVSAINPEGIKTTVGEAPKLPENVMAKLSDENEAELPVRWDAISAEKYSKNGTFEVQGTVNGTEIKTTATVTVVTPVSVEEISIETMKGVEPVLPDKVNVVYNDGSKEAINVSWGTWGYIDPSNYAHVGSFEIKGIIEGKLLQAKATVKVVKKNKPNNSK
ncbi:endo-alpha-N-acetylgalactosaminidase family protein [Clostridium sp.]